MSGKPSTSKKTPSRDKPKGRADRKGKSVRKGIRGGSNSAPPFASWQRHLLATFAVLFLVAGGICATTDLLQIGSKEFLSGTLLKVGFVLALGWVASPQLEKLGWNRVRGTLLLGVIIVIVLWSIRPRIGAIAGAVLVVGSLVATLTGWLRKLSKPPSR